MKFTKLALLTSCCLSSLSYALTLDDLVYESGSATSNYTIKGKPNAVYSVQQDLPQDLLSNIYSMLPEGAVVNPAFIAPERYSSIDIDDELNGAEFATASVTFLNEGAGFRNSLGYIVYDTDTPPTSIDEVETHRIVFPNASKPRDGDMVEGDTLDLDIELAPGQSLAFFVIPNGWGWGRNTYNNIRSFGVWNTPFYSLPSLNPEPTAELRRHNVAFLDVKNEFLVMGFEDLLRPDGDNDFNDLIFTVNITPFTAIDGVNSDGSTDAKYEILTQQDDPDLTTTSIYPSASGYATMAFEDLWPHVGDYDFNDVVLRYRVTEVLNAQRELKTITIDYTLQAMGAGYNNGFAVKLPNVDATNVDRVTVSLNGAEVSHEILQQESEAVLMVSDNIKDDLYGLGLLTESCHFYRTQAACLDSQPADVLNYQLVVEFAEPVSREIVGYPPYDSFIFAAENTYHGDFAGTPPGISWQTHFKQFAGTSLMNNSFYNMHDDNSGGAEFFLTDNNMPWAINIREKWQHPIERVDVSQAYPDFPAWVTSSGETNSDWYSAPTANKIVPNSDQ